MQQRAFGTLIHGHARSLLPYSAKGALEAVQCTPPLALNHQHPHLIDEIGHTAAFSECGGLSPDLLPIPGVSHVPRQDDDELMQFLGGRRMPAGEKLH